MRMKLAGFLAGMLIAVSALGATGAAAATEFGDNCVANQVTELGGEVPLTIFALTATSDPLSLTAPSAGVITSWKLDQAFGPFSTPLTLKVLRQTGPLSAQVVGESAPAIPAVGLNTFDTRIPVQTGDRLGLFAQGGGQILFCIAPGEKNQIGLFEGASVGASVNVLKLENEAARIPAAATTEPDADNDGYGDETQDKCPQNAATQAACPAPPPPVALSSSSIAKKGLVTVLVTANSQAPVTVAGTVKLGKGKSAKLSGGTQVVVPGAIAKFTLLFPEKLKSKLRQLSRKQFLWLNLAATAPNSAGAITTSNLKVKLKGQAKPRLHAKAKAKPKGQA